MGGDIIDDMSVYSDYQCCPSTLFNKAELNVKGLMFTIIRENKDQASRP